MILIKLGGSIITNKAKALSPRRKTIENIVRVLKKIDEPLTIVHGGGSFGHYWSVKFNMKDMFCFYMLKLLSRLRSRSFVIVHLTLCDEESVTQPCSTVSCTLS